MEYLIQILDGLELTLSVFAVSLLISFPLGILVAILRLSKIKPISKAMEIYIWVFRGTPLLLQILFVFLVIPELGLNFSRFTAIIIAFSLNYAAYFGEIFRAGFQSVEKGQREASEILGFSPFQINKNIILPQVIKKTLPAIGNEVITLVKDTSLVYAVGQSDILKIAKGIVSREGTLVPFLIAAILYLILTYVITKIFNAIERKVTYDE